MSFFPFKGFLNEGLSGLHAQYTLTNGRRNPCSDFELNSVECLEAYGLHRGSLKCKKYLEDFQECKTQNLSVTRSKLMNLERYKKIAQGKIPWSERKSDPLPYDSFMTGVFYP